MRKRIVWLLAVIFGVGGLWGCATPYDVALNSSYQGQQVEHDKMQQRTISAQAKAIGGLKVVTGDSADPRDKAMAAMTNIFLAREIRELEYTASTTKAPRLNTDNVEPLTKLTLGLAPFVTVARVVDQTADRIGDENYSTEGGDLNVEKTEVHATAIGDGNTPSNVYEKDTGAEPEAPGNESEE